MASPEGRRRTRRIMAVVLLVAASIASWLAWTDIRADVLVVLAYHGVVPQPAAAWEIDAATLARQIGDLRFHGYEPLVPADFERWWGGQLPAGRRFLLTFDDGLLSSASAAADLRREQGILSVFFIATALLGREGYLTPAGVTALASAGHRIELHGGQHVELTALVASGPAAAVAELAAARGQLAALGGRLPTWLAYCYGEVDAAAQAAVASAGLTFAFTIAGGAVARASDPLRLPRLMYLRDAQQLGEPHLGRFTPPDAVRRAGLVLTLAFMVAMLALSLLVRR